MSFRKKILSGVVTLLAAMTMVGAWAAWTSVSTTSNTGAARGKTSTQNVVPLVLASGATPTADVAPGVPGSLSVIVTNPNNFPMNVTDMLTVGTLTWDNPAVCTSNVAQANTSGPSGSDHLATPVVVAANATNVNLVLPGVIVLDPSAPNTCQGQAFTRPIQLIAAS